MGILGNTSGPYSLYGSHKSSVRTVSVAETVRFERFQISMTPGSVRTVPVCQRFQRFGSVSQWLAVFRFGLRPSCKKGPATGFGNHIPRGLHAASARNQTRVQFERRWYHSTQQLMESVAGDRPQPGGRENGQFYATINMFWDPLEY